MSIRLEVMVKEQAERIAKLEAQLAGAAEHVAGEAQQQLLARIEEAERVLERVENQLASLFENAKGDVLSRIQKIEEKLKR